MSKSRYRSLLNSKNWVNRRNSILKLDNHHCVGCNYSKNLQVHHLYYEYGIDPWDYPDNALVTLCKICHEKEHDNIDIKDLIKFNKKPLNFFPFINRKHKTNYKKSSKTITKYKGKEVKPRRTCYKNLNLKITIDDYNELFDNK